MVPHTEDTRITISGYCIYKDKMEFLFRRIQPQNVADAGVGGFASLIAQKVPFDIYERAKHPGTGVEVVTIYKGCWASDWSKTANIGNALVGENLTVEVQAVAPR